MLQNFKAISLSYKNAPIQVRETVALNEEESKQLIGRLLELIDVTDVLVVSTCNRTEIYYSSEKDYFKEIVSLLCFQKNIDKADFLPYFSNLQGQEAANYLFRVALGLESKVIGDLQIVNQVKRAYQWSADLNAAGHFLHRLLHTIFFANKRVVQETAFRSGAASVSYAAVALAEELAENLLKPATLLVLGLGEIGIDVAKNLERSSIKNIILCNRTDSKAEKVAAEQGFRFMPFEQLETAIQEADIIISSVRAEQPIITYDMMKAMDTLTFKYLIDLSVPRSIAAEIDDLSSAVLYNVDTIHQRVNESQRKRQEAIPSVERIVSESMNGLIEWSQEMEVSPVIHKLKNALEQIRQEEIARFVRQMENNEAEWVDKVTKNIMQKIIKLPVLQLKAACKRGEAETLIDVLNDLFNLEAQKVKK